MNTYVITLSQRFPATHPRKGEPTYFKDKTHNALLWEKGMNIGYSQTPSYAVPGDIQLKLHTIRANYPFWAKRFEKINAGEAVLSVRRWSGKPYRSKQIEIARLTKEDGIGLQKLEFLKYDPLFTGGIWLSGHTFKEEYILPKLANNDGLPLQDWEAWFKDYDKTKPLAIIHFTSFRY